MSSGSYYEEEMSSGGHRRLTAFILWPFPLSKKSPLDPPSPWSWLGAYEKANLFEIGSKYFKRTLRKRPAGGGAGRFTFCPDRPEQGRFFSMPGSLRQPVGIDLPGFQPAAVPPQPDDEVGEIAILLSAP